MLKAQNYNFMDFLDPTHIIQENKAIMLYFFEYFMQENMAKLIDQTLEKSCFSRSSRYDALSSRNISDQKRNNEQA